MEGKKREIERQNKGGTQMGKAVGGAGRECWRVRGGREGVICFSFRPLG